MEILAVCLLAIVFSLVESSPTSKRSSIISNDNDSDEDTSFERPITPEDRQRAFDAFYNGESEIMESQFKTRNAITRSSLRWPSNTVIYEFDPSFTNPKSQRVLKSMNVITTATNGCIKFAQRTNQKDYVNIINGKACSSNVGFIRNGPQPMTLGDACMYDGTIIHEILHALGFYHEQNRSDRDDYINVYPDNIKDDNLKDFRKLTPRQNTLYTTFDYNSIMAYGEHAFSKNGQKTMEDKNHVYTLKEPYNKPGMTGSDLYRLKKLYNCP